MPLYRSALNEAFDRETSRSIGKLVIGALSLLFVLYLASWLPGIDRLIPGTEVSFMAVTGGIVTLAIAAVLLYLASRLAALARLMFDGPAEVVEHLSSIVHWVIVLAAVIVTHRGLEPLVMGIYGGAAWPYDLLFLVLALPPLAIIAVRLYVAIDPAAELFAEKVAGG